MKSLLSKLGRELSDHGIKVLIKKNPCLYLCMDFLSPISKI